jgi:hypothetical protein
MKRRDFLKAAVGALTVAVVPLPLLAESPALPIQPIEPWYSWHEHGFAVLDNRRILLGEFDGSEKRVVSANLDTSD